MFGYIRIQKSELLVREYEAYKSVYCGLCKQMGKDYSFLSRFILSYDCTFYAMLLMSLQNSCNGFEQKRCRFNPLKKCSYCKTDSDNLSKAAALSVISAYYKILDDIQDSSFLKRTAYKIVKPIFAHWRKKASKRYPEIDNAVKLMLEEQLRAEKNPDCKLDMACDPTAKMLGTLLKLEGKSESDKRIYYQLGYGIGRWIYLIDAVDDYDKDIKKGNFNPFSLYKDDLNNIMEKNLSQSLAMAYDAYNLIDIVDFKGIIDNVILKGLPVVQIEILNKRKVKYEKSV
jgi:hypothetical protein